MDAGFAFGEAKVTHTRERTKYAQRAHTGLLLGWWVGQRGGTLWSWQAEWPEELGQSGTKVSNKVGEQ